LGLHHDVRRFAQVEPSVALAPGGGALGPGGDGGGGGGGAGGGRRELKPSEPRLLPAHLAWAAAHRVRFVPFDAKPSKKRGAAAAAASAPAPVCAAASDSSDGGGGGGDDGGGVSGGEAEASLMIVEVRTVFCAHLTRASHPTRED
jgi:hypothetical protein